MLTISRANSIHFVKVDGLLPNAENTLSGSERFGSFMIRPYCQQWDKTDTVTVQLVSDSDTVPTIEVFIPAPSTAITATLVASYPATSVMDARYYFEFDLVCSGYDAKTIQLRATQGTDVWLSEYQSISDLTADLADGSMIKIEYSNVGGVSVLPATQIDYTTGIEFHLYVEAVLKDIGYTGEDKIFTNIGRKELIEAQVFKTRKLSTIPLPEFMTDKITIAGKCFNFVVNDLVYTTDGVPDIRESGSNLRSLSWTLTNSEILGFTTDDKTIEITDMDGIITRYIDALVDTWTFIAPAGYLIHTVVAGHGIGSAGDYALTMGYSLHDDTIMNAVDVPLAATNSTMAVHDQPAFEADTTVYVEISGAGAIAKLYIQLLRNTPA